MSGIPRFDLRTRMTRQVAILFPWMAVLCLLPNAGQAVPGVSDSLTRALATARTDSARIFLHVSLANHLAGTDYKEALRHATSAVKMAERSGNAGWMITAYKVTGTVCMYMGLNDLAVEYFSRQYDKAEQLDDKVQMGGAYFNLGALQIALEDYVKAEVLVLKADSLLQEGYREQGSPLPPAIVLVSRINLGNIYMHLDRYALSDSLLRLSVDIAGRVPGMEAKLVSIHHLQGMLYLRMRDADRALAALAVSAGHARRLGDQAGLTAISQTAGQAYEVKGDEASAIRAYSEGYRSAEAISGLALQVLMAESLYKLYRKRGQADSSMRYFDLFTRLKERSRTDQAREEMTRLELMRSFRKMESGVYQQADQERRRQRWRTGLLSTLVLLLAWGAFVYRIRYRRSQLERVRRDLEARKLELEARRLEAELHRRDAELERISYELKKQGLMEALVGLGGSPVLKTATADDGGSVRGNRPAAPQSRAWEEFEYRFQQIHSGFYDHLNQRHPDLTQNERRLCAFLRLDMTTKEISDITGQSVTAVNMARIRLRRKLGLTHADAGLFEFLSSL